MTEETERCPECKASFQGKPIPIEHQHHFGGKTHFSRLIGIYCLERDRTTHWKCPDCGHEWGR
jgi:uncharacterized C2H2 Zn-finger protein